jgi:hypothetical protein
VGHCIDLGTLTTAETADTMPGRGGARAEDSPLPRVEYEKLIDLGIFRPGEPIELIGGELIVAEPQGAAHYTAILKTARALQAVFGAGWVLRTPGPIGLALVPVTATESAYVAGERVASIRTRLGTTS